MFTVFPLDSVFLLIDMGVFLAGVLEGVIIEGVQKGVVGVFEGVGGCVPCGCV